MNDNTKPENDQENNTTEETKWYENKWVWIAVAASLIIIATDNLRFQGDNWKSPEFQLSKQIVSYGIRGCGEYYWKRLRTGQVEIKCTRDGAKWVHHIISY